MKFLKYILSVSLLIGLSSCAEDFLELSPSNALPPAEALQTVDDLETVLLGVYSQLQNSDYYGRYFVLVPDVMSDNVKQNASANRAKEWAEYNGTDLDFIAEEVWTEIYEAVNRANTIINSDIDPGSSQMLADQLKGEALALRGLAHFDVARIYAQTFQFTNDASHPGVPVVLTFDQSSEPTRSSVAQVYQAVIDDLTQARTLMNQFRGKGFMSDEAAAGILSRVYLYMGDYAMAEQMATEVINSSNVSLSGADSYVSSWLGNSFSPDAVFDVVMTEVDNNGSDALGGMYISAGYGDYLPSEDLLNLINENDIRSQLFANDEALGGGIYGFTRVNKFPSNLGEDNTPVVRLAEMYLTRAEARARTGNEAGATEDLMTIRSRAWADAPQVTASGQDLIEEILTERRIELMFEGHRLWDQLRLQRGITRIDCTSSICEIPYPNDRFVLPLPQQELNANENINQNPGY